MKQTRTALFAAIIALATSFSAKAATEPTPEVKQEFSRQFAHPANVQWKAVSNLYEATFSQNGQYLTAFFSATGKLESVSRNISVNALPLLLQKSMPVNSTSWIADGLEFSGKNGTEYFITIENADSKTVYQSTGADWVVYQKTQK